MYFRQRRKMKSLFVGNLSFQTTQSDLTALFKAFGQVARVQVATDRDTGRARGFAFVEMPNDEEAAKAIAGLEGKAFGGRNLKVNEARPRTERTRTRNSSGAGPRPGTFSNEDYREAARQPREPRW
jgi:RNA recognition motif-containing protein